MPVAYRVDSADQRFLVNCGNHRIHLFIEGTKDRHLIAMAGDIGSDNFVDVAPVGCQHPDPLCPQGIEGSKGGGNRIAGFCLRLGRAQQGVDALNTKDDRCRCAAECQHINRVTGQDQLGC